MTFGKFLTLNSILYVVDISKNGFKMVFESDKFVPTQREIAKSWIELAQTMTKLPLNYHVITN